MTAPEVRQSVFDQTGFDQAIFASGDAAPPRANGELVFAAPWEARAFALAVAVVERQSLAWDDFRRRLVASVAAQPERLYYESWAAALEGLVLDLGLATSDSLAMAEPADRASI